MSDHDTPRAGQAWDADAYAHHAGFVAERGADIFAALAPRPGEAILDLGCGDGVLSARIAAAGATVTGLEPDPSMAAAARGRGLDVLEQDARAPFGTSAYDAVFSNAALHWIRDPQPVLANAFAALRPGGRLVAEQGGFGNVAAIRLALGAALEAAGAGPAAEPWDFPTPAVQAARLERAGFRVLRIALVPRPTPLPTGWAGWLATFGAPFLGGLDAATADRVIADCARRLAVLTDETGTAQADYVRLRFEAVRG
ncbi:class I SAM-dependent methyltransferase [Mangrovicoccus algicola]|uniref:Class I SAM-dependent methyltransferase n=1 Tax=Mangrovicoccus algicola TaxID=2771008 RepID=A0A8J7D0A1_9RHOB|nr:class I SAM-dependent methyltransferase [Mangrovicoccus algicola]MBE3639163.1 class I SAM-dependent methyltransferase [Mangrovicoccus algicola]